MNLHITALVSVCVAVIFWSGIAQCQKSQMTRTALHVARSLNPDSMESMSVRTKSGDTATIIVKKRNGKLNENFTAPTDGNSSSDFWSNLNSVRNRVDNNSTSDFWSNLNSVRNRVDNNSTEVQSTITVNDSLPLVVNHIRNSVGRALVPDPVLISSVPIFVKGQQYPSLIKRGKSLLKVDTDGIPVITGIRVPDDESDRQVWRNARVINGMLVPYDKPEKDHSSKVKPQQQPPSTTKPPSLSLSAAAGSQGDSSNDKGWTKISVANKKPTKIMPVIRPYPPTSAEQSLPASETPVAAPSTATKKPAATFGPAVDMDRVVLQTIEDDFDGPFPTRPHIYKQHPLGLWIPEEKPAAANSDERYMADKILDYIKNVNKDEMKRLSTTAHHFRNARMISPSIQSRILHNSESTETAGADYAYPESSAGGQPSSSRLSFEDGVRTPVLQYAHPEYGVQSARFTMDDNRRYEDEKESPGQQQYGKDDMFADRSPLAFEPAAAEDTAAAPSELRPQEEIVLNKRSREAEFPYRPKKAPLNYLYNPDRLNGQNRYNYYAKYPPSAAFFNPEPSPPQDYPLIYYDDSSVRPFWLRLSDTLKESVQSSIDKVTDLTRPVMEPLMEATNKISQNLGLSSSATRDLSGIKERLSAVSPTSLILPALGIVAGGAALGLGAVAVGRYLNYDVVKMRNGKSMDGLSSSDDEEIQNHLRSLWAEDNSRSPHKVSSFVESVTSEESPIEDKKIENTNSTRRKRSSLEKEDYEKSSDISLQDIESNPPNDSWFLSGKQQSSQWPDVWHDTPCSKKVFCQTMLAQPEETILIMEKRIISFLTKLPYQIAMLVSPHLEDVMSSVRRRDCSAYVCHVPITDGNEQQPKH